MSSSSWLAVIEETVRLSKGNGPSQLCWDSGWLVVSEKGLQGLNSRGFKEECAKSHLLKHRPKVKELASYRHMINLACRSMGWLYLELSHQIGFNWRHSRSPDTRKSIGEGYRLFTLSNFWGVANVILQYKSTQSSICQNELGHSPPSIWILNQRALKERCVFDSTLQRGWVGFYEELCIQPTLVLCLLVLAADQLIPWPI